MADCPEEKLSSIVRSVSQNNEARDHQQRSTQNTPQPWDSQTTRERPRSRDSNKRRERDSRESQHTPRDSRDSKESQRERIERYGASPRQQHARNGSGNTGAASSADYNEPTPTNGGRKHDYDVQSMETDLSSPRASMARNPIPAPTVTIRSEYPTLNRSRQQQSLTCLVTIEVPEGNWRPDPEDLRGAPQLPSTQQENGLVDPKSPATSRHPEWQLETPELLESVTQDLRVRVENWHGLEFTRYVSKSVSLWITFNDSQIRTAATLWHRTRRQRSKILAGTRVLPFLRDVDMREGEKRCSATVCGWQLEAQNDKMYSQGINIDQEALQTGSFANRSV